MMLEFPSWISEKQVMTLFLLTLAHRLLASLDSAARSHEERTAQEILQQRNEARLHKGPFILYQEVDTCRLAAHQSKWFFLLHIPAFDRTILTYRMEKKWLSQDVWLPHDSFPHPIPSFNPSVLAVAAQLMHWRMQKGCKIRTFSETYCNPHPRSCLGLFSPPCLPLCQGLPCQELCVPLFPTSPILPCQQGLSRLMLHALYTPPSLGSLCPAEVVCTHSIPFCFRMSTF